MSGRRPGRARLDGPSVVRVSAVPGYPADLGNDCLPDAVVEHVRNDALRCDIFDGFDRRLLSRRSPRHDHRYIHAAPARPRRARRLDHTYASRVAVRNRPPPGRSASRTKRGAGHLLRLLLPDESRQPASDPLLLLGPNGGPFSGRPHKESLASPAGARSTKHVGPLLGAPRPMSGPLADTLGVVTSALTEGHLMFSAAFAVVDGEESGEGSSS